MGIEAVFKCGGCFAEAKGTRPMRREFVGIGGRSYGFGSYRFEDARDVAPEGWVAFDPYTGCCYCPECWASIENGEA